MQKTLLLLTLSVFPAAAATVFQEDFTTLTNADFDTDTFVASTEFVAGQWYRGNSASANFGSGQLTATSNTDGFRGGVFVFDATSLATGSYTLTYQIVGISVELERDLAADGGALVSISQASDFSGFGADNSDREVVLRPLNATVQAPTVTTATPNGLQRSTGTFTTTFDYDAVSSGSSALVFGFGATMGNGTGDVSVVFDNISLASSAAAVPEASTASLLGLMGLWFGASHRRRNIARR